MNKIVQKITQFTNSKWMKILTNGFMNVAAISICGSIFSLVKSLPIPAYQTFLANSGLGDLLSIPVAVCSDVMALYIVLSMGYIVGKEYKQKNPFAPAVVALGTFLVLTPFVAQSYSVDPDTGSYIVNTTANVLGTGVSGALGASGIFLAILCGLFGSRLYIYLIEKGIKLRLPDSVPENVSGMFEMMIPGGLTFLVFLVIRYVVSLTPFGTTQRLIYTLLQLPLTKIGGGLWGALAYVTIAKLLWCFGVHGGMVAYSAMAAIMGTVNAANSSAFAAGTAAPYPEWALTTIMMDYGVLPLAIVMLLFSKSEQYKALSKVSLPTAIFNISEPQVFGIPMVLNPVIDIPFVLIQPINFLLTLLVMKLGLVAYPTGAGISTVMPNLIAFPLSNAHWTGFVWALILTILDIVIYLPFFKYIDKKALEEEQAAVSE